MPELLTYARMVRRKMRRAQYAVERYSRMAERLRDRLRPAVDGDWSGVSILDVGCGYTYPLEILWQGEVAEIVGLDISPFWRDGWRVLYHYQRPHGVLRAMGLALGSRMIGGALFRAYEADGIGVDHAAYDLRQYRGDSVPSDDNHFSVVSSRCVLEHVADLDGLARETQRVLQTGGIADHLWHNFYSLTGNHRTEDEARRRPWAHLIGQDRQARDVHPRTPEEVTAALSPYFEVLGLWACDADYHRAGVDSGYQEEGADLYEAAAEQWPQLRGFPRDLLVSKFYVIQLRKRC